ncbi:MAG: FAD-dependent oxidoreductase, partial [Dehalococcoidia bacterium]|nr:FAD-dependent oxidoreductase [Dehalococcoidia bacterium]
MNIIDLQTTESAQADVLIIGGGLAGIMAAIEARKPGADVVLVSKSRVGLGNNSAVALGGIAAAAGAGWRDPADRYEDHVRDTLEAGRFVNDRRLVEAMVPEIEAAIRAIETYGVRFKKRGESLSVTQVPGHSYPRTIFPEEGGGTSITRPMRDHALRLGVRHFEGTVITRILRDGDVVTGAFGINGDGQTTAFQAGVVILAAGGMGRLYLFGDNPPDATGDGYALAYEAGLTLRDMEFVQFVPGTPAYEIWVGRNGAKLRNRLGEDVLAKHGLTDLKRMTRDAVSRAAYLELTAGPGVEGKWLTLDASNVPETSWEKLQSILPARLRGIGKNLPMSPPEAHFFMGGVEIDEHTATDLKGLYACGEICAGVHGANRLGSNALSECLVFGARAGREAAQWARSAGRRPIRPDTLADELARLDKITDRRGSAIPATLVQELRNVMWSKVGIVRDGPGLQQAIEEIRHIRDGLGEVSVEDTKGLLALLSLQNMVSLSDLIARAALARTESRGAHY